MARIQNRLPDQYRATELDAEVRAVSGIVGSDGLDERRFDRAVLQGLQLRPGDVQHDLAEQARIIRRVVNGEGEERLTIVTYPSPMSPRRLWRA
jgi:hypothetical protein